MARTDGKVADGTRRGRGFASASVTARKRLSEAASGHGFAEPEVLLRWAEVVGETFADLCAPVKVTYPRGQGLGATLVVRAPGARAPEIEHLGPRIVERVNRFYGYRAVARIKVVQTPQPAPGLAEGPSPFEGLADPAPAPPEPAAVARAADLARDIQSDALRAALTRMGAHVLSRKAAPAKD
ncbi:MAG TPA: DciA family protein [Thermohalobaculum sp.]|nr:DciA family protein [Thermohalobaculum sp.]